MGTENKKTPEFSKQRPEMERDTEGTHAMQETSYTGRQIILTGDSALTFSDGIKLTVCVGEENKLDLSLIHI